MHGNRGQKPLRPTEQQRRQVESMTGYGIGQIEIARLIGCDVKSLRKHFRDELDTGKVRADSLMAEALWKNGVRHNNVAAQIWWTKARMGWKDQTQVNVDGNQRLQVDFRWADAEPAPPTIEAVADETTPVTDATTDADAEDVTDETTTTITFIGEC